MQTADHEVIIAGGGPTGLMLAAELALADVDVGIVERRPKQEVDGSRAGGMHPRTLELLDQRGIAERFVAAGRKHHVVMFPGAILDASDLPTRHNYWLALRQEEIERLLAERVAELGVTVHRGREVTGFAQDVEGVTVVLDGGTRLGTRYLVGCDGSRSLVRKTAGIGFPGWAPSISYLIFEGKMAGDPALGLRHGERGIHALGPMEDGGVRGVVTEPRLMRGAPAEVELRKVLIAAYGSDFGLHDVTWLSRFTDAARQAEAYGEGRVMLAGDAAHIHSPAGGQGLNLGLQDAANLGWKLAQAVRDEGRERLLDSYHAERHPAGAAVLRHTLALTALNRGDPRTAALREMMAGVIRMDAPRRWYTATMSGLDLRYGDDAGHPLLGRRIPDLDLVTAEGPRRLYDLMHDARPLLLRLGGLEECDPVPLIDRVRQFDARCDSVWGLPVVGLVPAPTAVLIRPDGHVAWIGEGTEEGLPEALATWFCASNVS